MMVRLNLLERFLSKANTSLPVVVSKFPVGSSAKIIVGLFISAPSYCHPLLLSPTEARCFEPLPCQPLPMSPATKTLDDFFLVYSCH